MSMFDRVEFEEWLDVYVDGELPPAHARRLEEAARSEPALLEELELARAVRDRLHSLPEPACPPEVTTFVISYARREARADLFDRIRRAVTPDWSTFLRPVLAVGILIAVVIGGTLVTRPQPERSAASIRTEDVERALIEAKWTLAYVSDIGRQTATSIRDEVFEERIVAPLNRAMDVAFDGDQAVQYSPIDR